MNRDQKYFSNALCAIFLVCSLVLGVMAPGGIPVFATDNTFAKYFKAVKITDDDGGPLAEPIARDAEVRIELSYRISDDAIQANTAYGFSLPTIVTREYSNGQIPIKIGDDLIATVDIVTETGEATICFTDYATNNDYTQAGASGSFFVYSQLDKSQIDNSTTKLVFHIGEGGEIEVPLNFEAEQIEAEVSVSHSAELELEYNRIKWKAEIEPLLRYADKEMEGYRTLSQVEIACEINKEPALTILQENGEVQVSIVDSNGATIGPVIVSIEGPPGSNNYVLRCTIHELTWEPGVVYSLVYYTQYNMGIFKEQDTAAFQNSVTASFSYPQYDVTGGIKDLKLATTTRKVTSNAIPANIEVSAKVLSKEQVIDTGKGLITWTVVANGDKVGFEEDYNLVDTIPYWLGLVGDVTLQTNEGSVTTLVAGSDYNYAATGTGKYGGGTLTIKGLSKSDKHKIVYTTEIDPTILKESIAASFQNKVVLTGKYGGSSYTFERSKTASLEPSGPTGGIIGGSGVYDPSTHRFEWTINLNEYKVALNSGKITIKLPKGLTYDTDTGMTYRGSAEGSSCTVSGDSITVTLPSQVTAEGKIILYTFVDELADWAVNNVEGTKYTIDTKLTNDEGFNLSANISQKTTSKVIAKEMINYDFNTKEITWKITFNQNKMAMKDISIRDTLPEGLTYVEGSSSVTGASFGAMGFNPNDNTITYKLVDMQLPITEVPSITYRTKVSDDLLTYDGAEPSKQIVNSAVICFEAVEDKEVDQNTLTATETKRVGARPLQKTGTQNKAYRNYTWTVAINANQIEMKKPELVDTLPSNLILDMESIRLFEAVVDSGTGALTQGKKVYDGSGGCSTNSLYEAKLNGQTFTFNFLEDITKAYLLVFDTDNMSTKKVSYSNAIIFAGEESSVGKTADIEQAAAGAGGTANPARGTIKLIMKEQPQNQPLPNATYTITGEKTGVTYTAMSDAQGVVIFTPLKFDTYKVTDGWSHNTSYIPLQTISSMKIGVDNKVSEQTLNYTKNGSLVTLDYRGNGGIGDDPEQIKIASGVNVIVAENRYDRDDYVFSGWNTKEDGSGATYLPGSDLILAENTVLYAQWNKAQGTITLIATSTDTPQVLFEDLAYTIVSKDGSWSQTKATDSDGKVVFPVGIGEYILSESLPRPTDYIHVSTTTETFSIKKEGDALESIISYEKGYTLDYDGNTHQSGTKPETTYHAADTLVTVGGNPFSKEGNAFQGWNTKADASGSAYNPADQFVIKEDTVLYAVWKENGGSNPGGGTDTGGGSNPGGGTDTGGGSNPGGGTDTGGGSNPGGGTNTGNESTPGDNEIDIKPEQPGEIVPEEPVVNPPVIQPPVTKPPTVQWKDQPTISVKDIIAKQPEAGKGSIVVTAVTTTNQIVANVVFKIEVDGKVYRAVSDDRGIAIFENLPPGIYEIEVEEVPGGFAIGDFELFNVVVKEGVWAQGEAVLDRNQAIPKTGQKQDATWLWLLTISILSACYMWEYNRYQQRVKYLE